MKFRTLLMLVVIAPGIAKSDENTAQIETEIQIVDDQGQRVPCCVYLKDAKGNSVQPPNLPFWKDHFCCDGTAVLNLAAGRYQYEIERGPEFASLTGSWDLTPGSNKPLKRTLSRLHDLAGEGWYSGELHIHRRVEDVPLLLQASDLDVGPTITWWNARNRWAGRELPATTLHQTSDGRFFDVMAGEDERGGGALLYFGLARPIEISKATREYPSSTSFLTQAKQTPAAAGQTTSKIHVDIEKPFWRDVPLWLASGNVDSMGIAHNHMWRSGVLENEAWGRRRDRAKWPPPHGNALWSQFIYYQALNCGFHIPPTAGSASGVLPNPVGYNRCYVHVDGQFDYSKWWEGLRAGRVFVTNGPLLTVEANGQLPGHRFEATGVPVKISLVGKLRCQERVSNLQIIRNGKVAKELPLSDSAEHIIDTSLTCDEPGWFLVRAITANKKTFRFASTGPFYVGATNQPRPVSLQSAEFFLNWAKQRRDELAQTLDSAQRDEVIAQHDQAIEFWEQKVALGE